MDYCENIAVFAFLWVVLRRDLCKDGSDKKEKGGPGNAAKESPAQTTAQNPQDEEGNL